jgi:hypothetical protein
MTWRYSTSGEPYEQDEKTASKKFRESLLEILTENKQFIAEGFDNSGSSDPITNKMLSVRTLSVKERIDYYAKYRIDNQLKWYNKKVKFNTRRHRQFFIASILLYILAIGCHIFLVIDPIAFNLASIFATVVGCFLSWTKMRQYRELAQSYAVTANEIALIKDVARGIDAEKDLHVFIGDAETAFSREHTLWLARRDVI